MSLMVYYNYGEGHNRSYSVYRKKESMLNTIINEKTQTIIFEFEFIELGKKSVYKLKFISVSAFNNVLKYLKKYHY